MKKFFLTVIVLIAVSSTCFAAREVRVSDYTISEFYRVYNNVAINVIKNNFSFNEAPTHVLSNETYDTYMTGCGPEGHGVIVSFFNNKQGHISKILLTVNGNDEIAGKCSAGVLVNVLATLGLNAQEVEYFIKNLRSGNVGHYCQNPRRYINVNISGDKAAGLIYMRFTALVD